MTAERSPKPPNNQRMLPTVSFSLPQSQLDRLREIAYARDVSLSRVAREALDLAFRVWDSPDWPPADGAKRTESLHSDAEDARRTGAHKPVRWPRQLRRDAARGRDYWIINDSRFDKWSAMIEEERS